MLNRSNCCKSRINPNYMCDRQVLPSQQCLQTFLAIHYLMFCTKQYLMVCHASWTVLSGWSYVTHDLSHVLCYLVHRSSQFHALNDVCHSVYAHWLRGRASHSRLREPGFESCAAVLKPWERLLTLHCSSSLSSMNEYIAIDSGGYVYEQPSCINCSIWLDGSHRSRDGV